jgi:hypothetical protein
MDYGYLIVEGHHDIEFIGSVLKRCYAFQRIKYQSKLDPFWYPLVPTRFPIGDDMAKRVPVPVFFEDESHSVAIHAAGGHTRIVGALEESLSALPNGMRDMACIGIVLDADKAGTPAERFNDLKDKLDGLNLGVELPEEPGVVSNAAPRWAVFVIPDNKTSGTLDDLLIECGEIVYPTILKGASSFVSGVDLDSGELEKEEKKEMRKPAGLNKARVACVASILKPGKAIQNSIQDNKWVTPETIEKVDRLKAFKGFLADLLKLS